jgi:hypothetical protein
VPGVTLVEMPGSATSVVGCMLISGPPSIGGWADAVQARVDLSD